MHVRIKGVGTALERQVRCLRGTGANSQCDMSLLSPKALDAIVMTQSTDTTLKRALERFNDTEIGVLWHTKLGGGR